MSPDLDENNTHFHCGIPCDVDHTSEFLPWDGKFTTPAYGTAPTYLLVSYSEELDERTILRHVGWLTPTGEFIRLGEFGAKTEPGYELVYVQVVE